MEHTIFYNIMRVHCCAECGEEGGVSLKIKYCDASCQRKNWPKHKKVCKLRAAELHDEALFKDPPDKDDCQICFLPMPQKFFSCASLPPATISSVPIYDFARANEELENHCTFNFFSCCGKSICTGCIHSFAMTGNKKCPYCNSDRYKTNEELLEKLMKRVAVNDAGAICQLAKHYEDANETHQDHAKSTELYSRAANLGCSESHYCLGVIYMGEGDLKKAKFHFEAAAIAGHEMARFNLGVHEYNSVNIERAVKHWKIAASAGSYIAMHELRAFFEREGGNFYGKHIVSRESFDSTLEAYNISCVEMRSEAKDVFIRVMLGGTNPTNNDDL